MEQNASSNSFETTRKLPNATAVIALGIISILSCCCYGGGLLFGAIALYLAKKDAALYNENPKAYSNYSNIKTGRILAIIGIILSVLMILFMIWVISIVGWENIGNEEVTRMKLEEYFEKR